MLVQTSMTPTAGAAAAAPSAEFGGAKSSVGEAIGRAALRGRPFQAEYQVPEMVLVPARNCLSGGAGYGQGLVSTFSPVDMAASARDSASSWLPPNDTGFGGRATAGRGQRAL